jgi:hypothetical protein
MAADRTTGVDRRSSERASRIVSRRSILAFAALLLAGSRPPARAQRGTGLMLPVGDLARLVRRLLAGRRDGVTASKRARLEDPSSGRKATLVIADDGSGTLALLLTFDGAGEPLHVHTVSVAPADGESLYLELFRVPPEGRAGQEIVGARLEPADLERLARAEIVTVTARGWDETFVATLEDKELEKIRRFEEKRRPSGETEDGG